MKLSEFKKMVERIEPEHADDDPEVVIVLDEPQMGMVANTHVRSIHRGIDWERGYVLIYGNDKLKRKAKDGD